MATTNVSPHPDEKLIKSFRSYPVKSFIFNLVVFLIYAASLIVSYLLRSSNGGFILLAILVFGCLISVVFNKILSMQTPKVIAEIMMKKYKTPSDSSDNPFFYYFRREHELLGNDQKKKNFIVLKILSVVLKIINLLFTLLASVFLLALALIPAIILGGFSYIAYIIFHSGGSNGLGDLMLRLAHASFIPLKYIWSFVCFICKNQFQDGKIPQDTHTPKIARPSEDHVTILGTDPKEMGKTQSALQIDSYLSVPQASAIFNPHCAHWQETPQLIARGSDVSFTARIVAHGAHYKNDYERQTLLNEATANVERELNQQIDRFLKDYPNATRATVDVKITVIGE